MTNLTLDSKSKSSKTLGENNGMKTGGGFTLMRSKKSSSSSSSSTSQNQPESGSSAKKKSLAVRKIKNASASICLPSPKLNKRYRFSILPSVKQHKAHEIQKVFFFEVNLSSLNKILSRKDQLFSIRNTSFYMRFNCFGLKNRFVFLTFN